MRTYDEIVVGERADFIHRITEEDIDRFVSLTGDDNKIHVDTEFAKTTSFKKPVVHGMLSASFISTIIGTKLPGDGALWFKQELEFLRPVRVNDEITIIAIVTQKLDSLMAIELSTEVFNQNKEKVISGRALVKLVSPQNNTIGINSDQEIKKVALITGATGGIGRAIAFKLSEQGYDIIIHYNHHKEKAIELQQLLKPYKNKTTIISADLLKPSELEQINQHIIRKHGTISVLVHCATLPIANVAFENVHQIDLQNHFNINVISLFQLIQSVLPLMKANKYGKIITILSQAIEQPNAGWLPYITGKSALSGFSKSVAIELARYGVRVNCVSPGMTDTNLIANIPEKIRLLQAAKAPLKRLALPEDIANVVSFLAHPDSDYLTGETIRVNGGSTMI